MRFHWGLLVSCWLILGGWAGAQTEPFVVHDTRAVILQGPYLTAPSNTGISIVWVTDTPCHSKVLYGTGETLDQVAEPSEHGLIPVGTVHAIRLENLTPGATYRYRAVSTRVVKLKPYWPEKGQPVESPIHSFTVPDPKKGSVRFSFITDTQHEDVPRIQANLDLIDWSRTEFLVHGGDAFSWIQDEDQLFAKWLDPVSRRLAHEKPLVFARGNHDLRGPYARRLYDYVPTGTGRFYYTFSAGPVHLLVVDTGEDKDDDTNVYARLNRTEPYREEEYRWLQDHVRTSRELADAPFRVVVMHAPFWGWVDGQNEKWTQLANQAGVDLVIAGHHHRFSRIPPGERGNDYTILVVGQDQAAEIEADASALKVEVKGKDGVIDSFVLPRRGDLRRGHR